MAYNKDCDKQQFIKSFLDGNETIKENTPSFIKNDRSCVEASIDRDIDSVGFLVYVSPEIQKYAVKKALEIGYVLNENSPYFLKSNIDVNLNSINLDVTSADYVSWYELEIFACQEQMEKLIDLIVAKGYVLTRKSHYFLRENPKVALGSVKKDIDSFMYIARKTLFNTELFHYLILNGVEFSERFLVDRTLNQFQDKDVLKHAFEQINFYGKESDLFKYRFALAFSKALNTPPSIEMYKTVFPVIAERQWDYFKQTNASEFDNLFGKISSELRNSTNYYASLDKLKFIDTMEKYLKDRYYVFFAALKEYFDIYHSDVEDKLDKMQPAQAIISSCAALYVSRRKEEYIKEQIEGYNRWLKKFFKLRFDNPTVDKILVQSKKKEKFKELYQTEDDSVLAFIKCIMQKYSEVIAGDTLSQLIDGFVLEDKAKLEEIITKPDKYDAYEKYKKAERLIKRLNLGYIKISGPEVESFRDIIGFDEEKGEYIYTGVSFTEDDLRKSVEYGKLNKIFDEIKREITLEIKNMEMKIKIDIAEKKRLENELLFKDEYFEFDKEYLSVFTLKDLKYALLYTFMGRRLPFKTGGFEDDDAYNLINKYLVDNGIVWLSLFLRNTSNPFIRDNGVELQYVNQIVNSAFNMSILAKELQFEPKNFKELLLLGEIGNANLESIAILGLDIVEKLCRDTSFTSEDTQLIISVAERLVAKMAGRSMSTVPYVSGETMNYKYSLYDSQDVDVLLAGINTDACFKVDGNDNDFLHYCCLDKNGFVIKITDQEGNFIARAAGFRNGNCVFLNQLRTIYDECGNCYKGEYENEKEDIIETLRKACKDIVRTSQENDLESEKIDHVFITQSYSLEMIDSNVSPSLGIEIGDYPMEMNSQDWENFVYDNERYLKEASCSIGFTTDYREYSKICLASIKEIEDLEVGDLRFGDVEALYERRRNKIIATTNIDSNILRKIKRISGIESYLNDYEYNETSIPEGSVVFVGDNWYLVYADGQMVDACVIDTDEKAKREYELTCEKLTSLTQGFSQQQVENGQIMLALEDSGEIKKLNKTLENVESKKKG